MSTQKSMRSSSEDEGYPASGQRLTVPSRSDCETPENELETSGFSGTCENTSLSDWIQLVQMNRRDAVIGIKCHDGRKALLWCREGDIIDAWCDGIIGEEAVYRALAWDGGRVSVAFAPFERARRIEMPTAALLLGAAHRRDSGVRQRAVRPSAIAFVAVDESLSSVSLPLPPKLPTLVNPPAPPWPNRGSAKAVTPPSSEASSSRPGSAVAEPPQASAPAVPLVLAPLKVASRQTPPVQFALGKTGPGRSEVTAVIKAIDRIRERRWLVALVLSLLPVLGLTAAWVLTPKSNGAPARKLAARAEPARPQAERLDYSASSPPPALPEPPLLAVAPEQVHPAPKAPSAPRRPAARLLLPAAPTPAAPAKPAAMVKASSPSVEERAPRVQIIEERGPKIEVIE